MMPLPAAANAFRERKLKLREIKYFIPTATGREGAVRFETIITRKETKKPAQELTTKAQHRAELLRNRKTNK